MVDRSPPWWIKVLHGGSECSVVHQRVVGHPSTRWIVASVDERSDTKLSSDITTRCTGTAYTHPFIDLYTGGLTIRTFGLRSEGCPFDSRSGSYQVVTTWMNDCGQVNHLGIHLTIKINSVFHLSGVAH